MKKAELLFFDSNVYINILRDPAYQKRLEPVLRGGFLYTINKIVLMELWAGTKTSAEENILRQHQKAFLLIGMQDDQFVIAGQLMSQMRKKLQFEPASRRRLTWDILIALSAKGNNALLVTENITDFQLINRWVDFEFMPVPQA